MEKLENTVIAKFHFLSHFYSRNVDDCILCIPTNKLNYTHAVLNCVFRLRNPTKISINFLDIKLKFNHDDTIETYWFRKKGVVTRIFTSRYKRTDHLQEQLFHNLPCWYYQINYSMFKDMPTIHGHFHINDVIVKTEYINKE